MNNTTQQCTIISNESVADGIYRLTVASGALAAADPGQFAMVACGAGTFLRRPFGFCDADPETGTATFMYRVTGAGTYALSEQKKDASIDILGPLGRGFEILPGTAAIVGGGIGLFPLLLLAKKLYSLGNAPDIFAGYLNRGSVVLEEELRSYARNFYLSSDDGSKGTKGYVTFAFTKEINMGAAYDSVYACGPEPMLRALYNICGTRGIMAQLSVEQRMGCGIGACLVCACAVKNDSAINADSAGQYTYARVCKDGPVFYSRNLYFGGGGAHG